MLVMMRLVDPQASIPLMNKTHTTPIQHLVGQQAPLTREPTREGVTLPNDLVSLGFLCGLTMPCEFCQANCRGLPPRLGAGPAVLCFLVCSVRPDMRACVP